MASRFIPTQCRFNDPYHQRITNYGTIYNKKYLSRASNKILKAFGSDMIMKGLQVTPSFLGHVITLDYTPGLVIHDSTLIEVTTANTLTCDVATVGDTLNTGSHLVVFSDFQYIETPDVDLQTALRLSVYHINIDGTIVTAFPGSPAFSVTRNKIMLSVLNFNKDMSNNVIFCSEVTGFGIFNILGVDYYIKGMNRSNIPSWDTIESYLDSVLGEFSFHDFTC